MAALLSVPFAQVWVLSDRWSAAGLNHSDHRSGASIKHRDENAQRRAHLRLETLIIHSSTPTGRVVQVSPTQTLQDALSLCKVSEPDVRQPPLPVQKPHLLLVNPSFCSTPYLREGGRSLLEESHHRWDNGDNLGAYLSLRGRVSPSS